MVTLNAGNKLLETIENIAEQSFSDYEIVVKDGGSKDDSISKLKSYLEENPSVAARVNLYIEKDSSIYDGMNEGIAKAQGQYIIFLNCGDFFADADVLKNAANIIDREKENSKLFYGDTLSQITGKIINSAPKITGFTCYRNIPCHQSCFYHRSLFEEKLYECKYKIRADYDHFLWCFYRGNANPLNMQLVVSSYEGGGYSESKENRKRDKQEHKEITSIYMSKRELFTYKAILLLTLAPLRTLMANSKAFSGIYNGLKKMVYKR